MTRWPLITGQGNTADAVAAKKQAITVQKDISQLAADCAAAAGVLVSGGQLPEGFAQTAVNNHVVSVPVRLCDFEVVVSAREQDSQEESQLQTELMEQ